MTISMLTTSDNPFDPFDEFEDWYAFDVQNGYNTCSYLARIAKTSKELSFADSNVQVENAIDEILLYNLTGNYKKVTREVS